MLRITFLLAAVFLLPAGPGVRAQSRPQRLDAATPASDTSRISINPRVFTSGRLDSLMEAGVRVDSLGAYPPKIWILEGGSFELRDLHVRAADADGNVVYGAPITLELGSMVATLGLDRIMGYRPGEAELTISSVLPRRDGESTATTVVDIEVYSR